MEASMIALPGEILACVVEGCDTKELLALSRSCKKLSEIAFAKLYKHVYYRHVGCIKRQLDVSSGGSNK